MDRRYGMTELLHRHHSMIGRPVQRISTSWGACGTRRRPLAAVLLALVLALLLGSPALAFTDVPAGHPYAGAISDLSSRGIINGYQAGGTWEFRPDNTIYRAQFAKMICGVMDLQVSEDDWPDPAVPFTDLGADILPAPEVINSLYPHEYVAIAYLNAITTGQTATTFEPYTGIKRVGVVSMMVRAALNLRPGVLLTPPITYPGSFPGLGAPHGENLRIAEYNGLMAGLVGFGAGWKPYELATRGETAQMLHNLLGLLGAPGEDVWVYTDGSGDYPTIEAAVAGVETGTTIHLGPGTFPLTETLWIGFSLRFVGSGMDGASKSIVTCPDTVVDVGPVVFSAADIRFVCQGSDVPTNVMVAEDATIDLQRCHFEGAVRRQDSKGSGLYLQGATEGTVRDCVFTLNDLHGMNVADSAQVTLTGNEAHHNLQDGIYFSDTSDGLVRENACSSNGLHGIGVKDNVHAVVENNECSDNEEVGIRFAGSATGTIRDNTCESNGLYGIVVREDSQAVVENNDCSNNDGTGIRFAGSATGTIRDNTCESNVYHGISLQDDAHALVEKNTCLNNLEVGIYFMDRSYGSVRDNECAGNKWGLYVWDTANPTIGANDLHGNTYNLVDERVP